jgi:hypothetical protein
MGQNIPVANSYRRSRSVFGLKGPYGTSNSLALSDTPGGGIVNEFRNGGSSNGK